MPLHGLERYTPPEDYRWHLIKPVTETRGKEGILVLLTPVMRRYFDQNGRIRETHVAGEKAHLEADFWG